MSQVWLTEKTSNFSTLCRIIASLLVKDNRAKVRFAMFLYLKRNAQ